MLNSPRRAIEAMRHSKYIYHSQGVKTTSSTVIAILINVGLSIASR